eukprot:15463288-Alexandrium_andersonii.AAC.1
MAASTGSLSGGAGAVGCLSLRYHDVEVLTAACFLEERAGWLAHWVKQHLQSLNRSTMGAC